MVSKSLKLTFNLLTV